LTLSPVFADLHVHSTASDGLLSPRELVEHGKKVGLKAIALTDHDTLQGIADAQDAGAKLSIEVIPGIEISCGWEEADFSLHVVGLFVDYKAIALIHLLDQQKKNRYQRAHRILDLLEECKVDVAPLREQFLENPDKVLGRPHVARYLLERGVVKEFQDAFDLYLLRGRPAFVPKEPVDPKIGIEAIQNAGGVAILAHPGLIRNWKRIWKRVKDLPWDGLEVFYSEHSAQQIHNFSGIVSAKGWLASGGSDYHGEYGKHAKRLGNFGLNEEQFLALKNGAVKRREA